MKRPHFLWIAVTLFMSACTTNAITGRKQLSLFPESTLQAEAVNEYRSFLSQNRVDSPGNSKDAEMVRRVGNRIATAITTFYRSIGLASELECYDWQFNLVQDDQLNA